MTDDIEIKDLAEVVVRFSGDSGDGMQLWEMVFQHSLTILPTSVLRMVRSQESAAIRCILVVGRYTLLATNAMCSWL